MVIFKSSVIRSFVLPLSVSLFIPKFCFLTVKTQGEIAVEHPIFKAFRNHTKFVIITNQGVARSQSFIKQLILKKNGSSSLIEILSLSLGNLKVGVVS